MNLLKSIYENYAQYKLYNEPYITSTFHTISKLIPIHFADRKSFLKQEFNLPYYKYSSGIKSFWIFHTESRFLEQQPPKFRLENMNQIPSKEDRLSFRSLPEKHSANIIQNTGAQTLRGQEIYESRILLSDIDKITYRTK